MLSQENVMLTQLMAAVKPMLRETAGEAIDTAFEDAGNAIEDTANDVADVLWDGKPDPLDNEEDNQFNSLIGEILIGFGLVCFQAGWATQSWAWWPVYLGQFFTVVGLALYVWAVLKWNDARVETNMKTAFRSWRINQLSFWGNVGVAIITIGLSWYRSGGTGFLSEWGMVVAAFVGAAAIGVGIYFGWAIKGLWYNYDIAGTLKNQDFDYFKWTDRTDQDAIFLAQLGERVVEF